MTKEEYIERYYATDDYLLLDLIEDVWNDACKEMLKEINELFLVNQKNLSPEEISMFYKTVNKINDRKPTLK